MVMTHRNCTIWNATYDSTLSSLGMTQFLQTSDPPTPNLTTLEGFISNRDEGIIVLGLKEVLLL